MSLYFVPEKPFSQYLRELREERNLSVRALSNLSGVSQACILSYEKGKSQPNLINAVNLSYALGVSLKDLVFHLEEDSSGGIVCYDTDEGEEYIVHIDFLSDFEYENHFCAVIDKKLFLFSRKADNLQSGYLLKDSKTDEFKLSKIYEEGFDTVGYLIREITDKSEE